MKILYVLERPIQNDLPYQLISTIDHIDVTVFCIENGKENISGNENINISVFDNKSLYVFPYEFLNTSNSLLRFIKQADIVIIYGHFHPIFRKAILLTKLYRKKLILTSDATSILGISESSGWKLRLKPFLFRILYNHISEALFVPSTASKTYFEKLGIKSHKIILTPYTVNEVFIQDQLLKFDSNALKKLHGINYNDIIFLFCGKLIQRKRAEDLLIAFALLKSVSAKVIIIGDGPLRCSLEKLATDLNIRHQVIFLGLVPYHNLVAYYALASVLVVPAEHEPFGLPVNESMICGTPVIASNVVGAAGDLIKDGVTGFTYPVADIVSLSNKMKLFIEDPSLKSTLSNNCVLKMESWSSQSNVDAQLSFFKQKGWLT